MRRRARQGRELPRRRSGAWGPPPALALTGAGAPVARQATAIRRVALRDPTPQGRRSAAARARAHDRSATMLPIASMSWASGANAASRESAPPVTSAVKSATAPTADGVIAHELAVTFASGESGSRVNAKATPPPARAALAPPGAPIPIPAEALACGLPAAKRKRGWSVTRRSSKSVEYAKTRSRSGNGSRTEELREAAQREKSSMNCGMKSSMPG